MLQSDAFVLQQQGGVCNVGDLNALGSSTVGLCSAMTVLIMQGDLVARLRHCRQGTILNASLRTKRARRMLVQLLKADGCLLLSCCELWRSSLGSLPPLANSLRPCRGGGGRLMPIQPGVARGGSCCLSGGLGGSGQAGLYEAWLSDLWKSQMLWRLGGGAGCHMHGHRR